MWWRAWDSAFPTACRWYPCCKISDRTFKEQDLRMSVPTIERRAFNEPDSLAPATENPCFTGRFYKGPQWQSPSVVLGRWRWLCGLDLMSYLTQRPQILGAESWAAWCLCVPLCEEGRQESTAWLRSQGKFQPKKSLLRFGAWFGEEAERNGALEKPWRPWPLLPMASKY